MLRKTIITLFSALLLLCYSSTANAAFNGFVPLNKACRFDGCTTAFSLYAGHVDVKTVELVLYPGASEYPDRTISKLDWTANNIWVLGATGKLSAYEDRIFFTVDGWSRVFGSKGRLEDRDYLNDYDPYDLTHLSIHSDTKLKTAVQLDVQCGFNFYSLTKECSQWNFGCLIGYKFMKLHWDAHGGHYDYDTDTGPMIGTFPAGKKVIAYTQKFSIPYLGLQANWKWDSRLDLTVFAKYSGIGDINCLDHHVLRSIFFTDKYSNGEYWELGGEATWKLCDRVDVNLKYAYNKLNKTRGDTTAAFPTKRFSYKDSAGLSHSYQLVALGLSTTF